MQVFEVLSVREWPSGLDSGAICASSRGLPDETPDTLIPDTLIPAYTVDLASAA